MKTRTLRLKLALSAAAVGAVAFLIFGAVATLALQWASHGTLVDLRGMLLASFIVALPAALLTLGFVAYFVSGKALRSVDEITAAAGRISAERLDQRLPTLASDDELSRLTAVLNAMIDRLHKTLDQTRRFSADASHELKTPLTIIRGEIESTLRLPNLPAPFARVMLNLQEETGHLIHLVEGLLLISQAEAGRLKLDRSFIEFSTFIEELTEDVEILASPKAIALETDFEKNIIVDGDIQFLRQVLFNLYDNAIKYNVVGGLIRATLKADEDEAVLTIANTGTAIPDEERERIFERFHRAEKSRDRKRGGQGLGLSICREIIRSHDGQISVVPAEPGWTAFQVKLPCRQTSASGILRITEYTRRAAFTR